MQVHSRAGRVRRTGRDDCIVHNYYSSSPREEVICSNWRSAGKWCVPRQSTKQSGKGQQPGSRGDNRSGGVLDFEQGKKDVSSSCEVASTRWVCEWTNLVWYNNKIRKEKHRGQCGRASKGYGEALSKSLATHCPTSVGLTVVMSVPQNLQISIFWNDGWCRASLKLSG